MLNRIKAALGGTFTTVHDRNFTYETNGYHTVRAVRNGAFQIENHELKSGNNQNHIEKGRCSALALKALKDAGFVAEHINISDGRGGRGNAFKSWPSLYVNAEATTSQSPASTDLQAELELIQAKIRLQELHLQTSGQVQTPEVQTQGETTDPTTGDVSDPTVDEDGDGEVPFNPPVMAPTDF